MLRALLRGFYSYRTGECFPSHEAIAEAAGCCVETVRQKLRVLEAAGIIETIRRKVVASFTSRVHRVRFDFAVQTIEQLRLQLRRWPTGRRMAIWRCRCCETAAIPRFRT